MLERGLIVTGIDPAEMDESILANPNFTHIRKRASDVKRREFKQHRWLVADANVAPKHTLDAVESIVTNQHASIRGMLLTLKLPEWKLAAEVPDYVARVESWGFGHVRARQLAFNRQEVCIYALRNRAMRRFTKSRRPRSGSKKP